MFSLLEPPQIIPFTFGKPVTDSGDFAQLTCVVSRGDMPVTITWSLKGQKLNSGPSITTTMVGTRTSMLIISDVDFTHIGEYTCRATNNAGSVTHSAVLKVNGKSVVTQGKALERYIQSWLLEGLLLFVYNQPSFGKPAVTKPLSLRAINKTRVFAFFPI